ncbi:hypothetical protein H1Z61_13800 [Bacillus aquiflavi]|uniref:GNAT family N-acetyltransferase n=1 Tax=Bacillus aquiflavi TaxID=2672567 RepID=A0A6B3VZ18_9BACI|nr:hypothetical protein [Bacillus aquiflavi]MBA4538178.1 hypothetical protein [Bacillus aquiflavi]NEY82498.1 hypothetical protein [Bacillus aquiflavi]UAC48095.1 hypothetical protein K6959_16160 [Bacillus aquiflavi]
MMKMKLAEICDALLIHDLKAFSEYRHVIPLSSTLEETVHSISTALKNGEQALIGYVDEEAVGIFFNHILSLVYFIRTKYATFYMIGYS